MFDRIRPRRGNIIYLSIILGSIYLIFSCAPAPTKGKVTALVEERPARIESVSAISGPPGKEAAIEITTSRPVPYTAFKLVQPLRLIVEVDALPVEGLTGPAVLDGRIIKAIHHEGIKDRPLSTRIIATLSQDVEYDVQEQDGTINVLLSPKRPVQEVEKPVLVTKKEEVGPTEPRLFFSPGITKLNQILGIDFFMLPRGKSRIIVTTSKKAEYALSQKNSLTLLLRIKGATIPRELTRCIDSSYFKGTVNQITPIAKVAERRVDLEIRLKEMVPYCSVQTDREIRIDFDKTTVKPPAKKITPARLTMALERPEKLPQEAITPVSAPRQPTYGGHKRYTGARITLDLVNADIKHILKLIGEVSKLNIVWGPEVKGTVSMRLEDVPWDQALDLVLEVNDLGIVVK